MRRNCLKGMMVLFVMAVMTTHASAQSCPDGNHPHAIDLGLPSGTKWACCNVGASKPEGYGGYYAWGETSTKHFYIWLNYKWCESAYDKQTKYNTKSSYGKVVDNITQLEPSDDVAHTAWGGSWCMPTRTQLNELISNTTKTWTTINGVNGMKCTGSNGNYVFIPAAGFRSDGDQSYAGSYGCYWSSTLNEAGPYNAQYFIFNSGGAGTDDEERCVGHSVRGVRRN